MGKQSGDPMKRERIGAQLRKEREARGWTVTTAAFRSGLQDAQVLRLEASAGGLFATCRQLATAYGKKISVRNFPQRKEINYEELSRDTGLNPRTVINCLRLINSPYNHVDHLEREWSNSLEQDPADGMWKFPQQKVLHKAEDVEVLSMELLLSVWSDDASLYLK